MTRPSARVRITYCAECGYEPRTLELAGTLMRAFGQRLSSIELVPWFEGAFDVSIDGEIVHSMRRDGGFPRDEDVVRAVRERLSSGTTAP